MTINNALTNAPCRHPPCPRNLTSIFMKFVEEFGTHYIKEAELGAMVYYEKRFTKRSKTTTIEKFRASCVEDAAQGCVQGNIALLFFAADKQTCKENKNTGCTVR